MEEALDDDLFFRHTVHSLTEHLDLNSAHQEDFLERVGRLVSPGHLSQLEAGGFNDVAVPDMYQALQLSLSISRAQLRYPVAGSLEIEYAKFVTNAFLRGALTGVPRGTTLGKVVFKLLGREETGSTNKLRELLYRSGLRGISGRCLYYEQEQEYNSETLWKLFYVLLKKRDDFVQALNDDGIEVLDDDVEGDGEGEGEEQGAVELELGGNVDLLPGWAEEICEETGQRYYYHAETGDATWTRPTVPVIGV